MKGSKIKIILGLILLSFISCAVSQSVSDDYILEPSTINTEDLDYEIIPIHRSRIQKRDTGRGIHLSLKAFGEHIKLWLEPHDGILATAETPIFCMNPDGILSIYNGYMKEIVNGLYEDAKEAATMIITKLPNGNYKLNGVIGGKRLSIRPVSNKFNYKRYKRFVKDIPESERDNYTYHIVNKLPEVPDHLKALKPPSLNIGRSKRSIPDIVYPEVLIVVDYWLFKQFEREHYYVIKYVLAFWNSVDLAYRSLQNPKYRINIAGIVIAEGPKSLPYMQYSRKTSIFGLLVKESLVASAPWVKEIDELLRGKTNFDVVITLSSTPFIREGIDGVITRSVGLAYTKGACALPVMVNTPMGYIPINHFKSAMVYDEGGYSTVLVAAHELGHLLGADHDGTVNQKCNEAINVMAPILSMTANASDWSYCSVKDFENFLNSQQSECLFNKPKMGTRISRFLPGKLVDADTQCKYFGQLYAVDKNETICVKLICMHTDGLARIHPGAAEGTPCGENKICLHKQCVDLDKITD